VLHEKNVTEFKTLKIAFGLSFFNLCVSRLLVQTTRFVVKYLKPCMGQISGTWELLLCEYLRKSMIIGEKNTDLKRLTKEII
jgi:hypothetical protein